MQKLPELKIGDMVEIIAPASRCSDTQLLEMKELLESWQLTCLVREDIFAKDLLCANTDEARFKQLQNALENPKTKAIFCARGGYGSMRLINKLREIAPPAAAKIFVGMSDTTCLQLYLQQHWGWPTIHGSCAPDRFSAASIAFLKSILFADTREISYTGIIPLNQHAKMPRAIECSITGGNLSIIQAGIGTCWQMDGRNQLILLEEIRERAYRIDRMLEHLQQANIFKGAAAILLADFLGGNEPDGSSLTKPVLARFAENCDIPVIKIEGIGHGNTNFAIPLGAPAVLKLGEEIQLTCFR